MGQPAHAVQVVVPAEPASVVVVTCPKAARVQEAFTIGAFHEVAADVDVREQHSPLGDEVVLAVWELSTGVWKMWSCMPGVIINFLHVSQIIFCHRNIKIRHDS